MEIIFLGTSGCIPTDKRGLSAVALDYLGDLLLFDCGEGTQRQMRHAGLNFMRLDHVFLTHLHADHFLGLGGMIQSMDFLERDRPLNIYGPRGTKETINALIELGTFSLDNFEVEAHEVDEGLVYDGGRFKVSCARTIHTKNSVAYLFEENAHRRFDKPKALALGIPEGRLFSRLQKGQAVEVEGKKFSPDDVLGEPIAGRKMVYTGDTRPTANVVELARNADILIHESMFSAEDEEATKDAAHSTTKQAAQVAKDSGVKKLYLTHISQRYTEPGKLEAEAREIFPETYVAEDLLRIKVDKHW
ncbi:MAG: ribonuclease Z [Candidatus Altiarchaeota archaeon]